MPNHSRTLRLSTSSHSPLINCAALLFAFGLAAAAALYGINRSRNTQIEPSVHREMFSGISRDTWIEHGAEIDISTLPPGDASFELHLSPWRPSNAPPTILTLSICGIEQSPFEVNYETANAQFKIPTPCTVRKIGFKFSHTIPLPDRRVGVQLKSITYLYPFTWHLAQTPKFAVCTGMLFMLSAIIILFWPGTVSLLFGTFAVPVLAGWLMSNASAQTWTQLGYLWLLITALCLAPLLSTSSDSESEKREPGPLQPSIKWTLVVLVIGAAILRFYDLGFGLPDHYHPDEPRKGVIALKMILEANYDPGYFLHPTLLLYFAAIFGKLFNLVGLVNLDIDGMLYSGRAVSAVAGVISVYLVFLLGRKLFSASTGLLAAALLTFMPLHVTCSRYMKEDSLLTMFVLACAVAMLKGAYEKRVGWILLAGILAGLATSSKYSGMLTAAIVLATPWMSSRRFNYLLRPDFSQFGPTLLALALGPIAFFCGSPYVVLNSTMFIRQFNNERLHMLTGHHKIIVDPWSQFWMYHFSNSVVSGMTTIVAVAAILGLGIFIRKWRTPGLFVLACVLLFYLPAEWVNAKPPPQPERYILPCVPFLCLAAAYFIAQLRRASSSLATLVGFALVAVVAARSIALASEIPNDTRIRMRSWILDNVPEGSTLMIDAVPYSSRLPRERYSVKLLWTIPERRAMTVEALKASGYDYLLLTSLSYDRYFLIPNEDQVIRARFEEIFAGLPLAAEMAPKYGTYGFHNPILRLYKLR